MNLVVDIGNSNLKWTRVGDGPWQAGESVTVSGDIDQLLNRIWGDIDSPQNILISNVSGKPMEGALRHWIGTHWGTEVDFFRSAERYRNIRNGYRDPTQLGCDRWAAIIGGRSLSAGDLCVVDCGTAVTIDALTRNDRFIGGIIFPGASLVRNSLLQGTSDITEKRADFGEVLGLTTAECVSGGSNFGVAGAVDRILSEMEALLDDPTVFITGGGAGFLLPFLHHTPQFEPDLVLMGLAQTME
jgi:type III pantothenate kinase